MGMDRPATPQTPAHPIMEIREIVVVEGIHDKERVQSAVAADVVVTGGSHIRPEVFGMLARAAGTRGVIVLTDPDFAGEQIRRRISEAFPACRHAFLSRAEAEAGRDVGVENASPDAIRAAFSAVRDRCFSPRPAAGVVWGDMLAGGLAGTAEAARRRECVGRELRIGYGNAKTFFKRLNALNVSRQEFEAALRRCAGRHLEEAP